MTRYLLDPRRSAALLAATGWSRRALARELGLHVETVSRWIRGRHAIPEDRLQEIAAIVDVPVSAFLGVQT